MRKLTMSTFPLDDELLNLAANAHNTYQKRVKEQAVVEAQKKKDMEDKMILNKLKEEKSNDPTLRRLNAEAEQNEKKIKEAIERKDNLEKYRANTLIDIKNADTDLKNLWRKNQN